MSGDFWLQDYEQCSQQGLDIMTKINERNQLNRTSQQYTRLSAQIRTSMRQFSGDIQKLRNRLIQAVSSHYITQREMESRQGMIDKLTTKEKQIEQAFKNEGSNSRNPLLAQRSDRSDTWGAQEDPNRYDGVANVDLRVQQQHIIIEQDRGLDALAEVIARQKNMAVDIGTEVGSQNELLDAIYENTDRTNQRMIRETRHIWIIEKRSASCCFWIFIILLFVVIVIVLLVPYNGKGV